MVRGVAVRCLHHKRRHAILSHECQPASGILTPSPPLFLPSISPSSQPPRGQPSLAGLCPSPPASPSPSARLHQHQNHVRASHSLLLQHEPTHLADPEPLSAPQHALRGYRPAPLPARAAESPRRLDAKPYCQEQRLPLCHHVPRLWILPRRHHLDHCCRRQLWIWPAASVHDHVSRHHSGNDRGQHPAVVFLSKSWED
ncbi:uncharacterized protein BJ171DRAFT_508592 [Polychytrium aggregatum]|uniref:uncharacterized protein n=1 Tax=Polychytrium aggregatum TaxID=110093 RepID=UPI0022FEF693|nr:uncharacterized protein BJ171DRAFT_508592 [Polychytrium aggregatum]KAI9203891.1 hypothetical protein BJ171DRAFT_508592 [Polychytrium aggregatum]